MRATSNLSSLVASHSRMKRPYSFYPFPSRISILVRDLNLSPPLILREDVPHVYPLDMAPFSLPWTMHRDFEIRAHSIYFGWVFHRTRERRHSGVHRRLYVSRSCWQRRRSSISHLLARLSPHNFWAGQDGFHGLYKRSTLPFWSASSLPPLRSQKCHVSLRARLISYWCPSHKRQRGNRQTLQRLPTSIQPKSWFAPNGLQKATLIWQIKDSSKAWKSAHIKKRHFKGVCLVFA